MRSLTRQIILSLSAALVLLVGNAVVSYRNILRLIENEQQVSHSHEVIAKLETTLSTLKDAETGQRGYLITGVERYLGPYNRGTALVNQRLDELKRLTIDNPTQQRRIQQLERAIATKLDELQLTIQLRRQQGFAAAQQLVLTNRGKQIMDGIRQQVAEIEAEEERLLQIRSRESQASARFTLLTFTLASSLNLLLLGAVYSLIKQAEQRQQQEEFRQQQMLDQLEQERDRLKDSEAEVRQLNTNLERRVDERTAQLQAANEALESFAYSVAHDLRAPLRGMQGLSEALLEDYGDRLDDLGKEYAQQIVHSAGQLEDLIEDLLVYSRLSQAELPLKPVDLDEVVTAAIAQVKVSPDAPPPEIQVDAPLPWVLAHRATLVQVVINLLSNGIKFVDDKMKAQLHIWVETVSEQGLGFPIPNPEVSEDRLQAPPPTATSPDLSPRSNQWIRLWVADNGIGIAAEHQQRIFRVFERLHGIETYPGTGIGLAVVQKGIERMGGRVGVKSQLGQGSQFWIILRSAASTKP